LHGIDGGSFASCALCSLGFAHGGRRRLNGAVRCLPPIRDRSGIAIGTMNVGYAYGGAKDAKALVAHAVALRDELQASIAATPALEEIDP